MFTNIRHSRSQRGSASVEAILVMPLLLLFITASMVSLKLMFLNLHNRAETRTLAWERALHGAECRQRGREGWSGFFGDVPDDDFCRSGELPELPGERQMADLGAPPPATYWVSASANAELEIGQLPTIGWNDTHSVDAIPEWWPASGQPLGYDLHMDRMLDSDHLFTDPHYFPAVQP